MESSIAEFLLRRLACELLPTMYVDKGPHDLDALLSPRGVNLGK